MFDLAKSLKSCDLLVRNEAALKVADDNRVDLLPHLIDAIFNPVNYGKNGTLVHALSYFDCSAYFLELVRCAVTQGYEAHSEAMYIIDNQNFTPNEETLKKVAQIFEGLDSVKLLDFQKEAKELISSRYGL